MIMQQIHNTPAGLFCDASGKKKKRKSTLQNNVKYKEIAYILFPENL